MSTLVNESASRMSRFELLPPEIRNMIYSLCIVTSTATIRSPLKTVARRTKPFSTFWNILLVNKTINQEASAWYYRSSYFIFGNHEWGSTEWPNQQALQAFIRRVPKPQLANISRIAITIYGKRRYYDNGPGTEYILGSQLDMRDLRSMIKSIVKHFTGLESLTFLCGSSQNYHMYWPKYVDDTRLQGDELVKGLRGLIELLVKHKTLKCVEIFTDATIPMHKAAQELAHDKPHAAKLIEIKSAR